MRDCDIGLDETGKHNPVLTPLEAKCLETLQNRGSGVLAAISGRDLTRALGIDSVDQRNTRYLVNHLIMTHQIPIMCQAGSGGGYYLTGSTEETQRFYRAFHKRAMTGLVKASKGRKASFVDIMTNLALGYDDPDTMAQFDAVEHLRLTPDPDPLPAWVYVATNLLERLASDPQKYAEEIRRIQQNYGDIFVPRHKVAQIREMSAKLQEMLAEIA
jgi:hypothetical protein